MQKLLRDDETPLFVPYFMAKSVLDIDFAVLKRNGVRYVAFDADSTLVAYRAKVLTPESEKFLKRQLKQFDGVCVASNRATNDLADIANSLDAEVIRASLTLRKPAKGFFDRVVRHFKARPHEIVMIGDKLVADIYGGNRASFQTVWVEQNGRDHLLDRVFQTRRLEKWMMRRFIPGATGK
jgi:HAD superfamily phosphatase (TIGR01668 family)